MTLWEITTGGEGESYERAHVWAETPQEAVRLFKDKNKGVINKILHKMTIKVRHILELDVNPFCTTLDDAG